MSFIKPRRVWWSCLCSLRCCVRWAIRCWRRAIWTSGEPVSVSWSRYSAIVSAFSGMHRLPSAGRRPVEGDRWRSRAKPGGSRPTRRSYQPVAWATGHGIYPDRVAARGPWSPGGELEVTPSFRIPTDELAWRFTGSGGPGGQHANTSNTRVELSWDVAASAVPGPRQRALLLERLGPTVRVVVSTERSQARNRELAFDRLRARVASALRVDPPRRPTRP